MRKFELTSPDSFYRRAAVVTDPVQIEVRLRALHPDLTPSLLRDAVMGGLRGRNEVTRASAPTAAGVQHWMKTVEDLRMLLATAQWRIHQERNCPFISAPDRTISLVVMTGNSETGKNGIDDPTNQAEKGVVAEGFVQKNNQLELFNRRSLRLAERNQNETQVWALLYHYDKTIKEVRYELSLPTGFGRKRITEWGERLVLGSIPNNPSDFAINKDRPNSPATVLVEPRTGTY